MRIILTIALLLLGGVILVQTRPDTHAELLAAPPLLVDTIVVRQLDIQPSTRVTGRLEPALRVALHFQVVGQIDKRLVEMGQAVKSGDVLLNIHDDDFLDQVMSAEAALKLEQERVKRDKKLLDLSIREHEIQQREIERLQRLNRDSLSSQSRYDQALQRLYQQQAEEVRLQHSLDTAQDRLLIEQARLQQARRELERTQLTAPFDAVVNALYVEAGDYVGVNQAAIELVQVDQLDLLLHVTGETASGLSLGQAIKVNAGADTRWGKIIALAADPDPKTHTHAIKIRLPSEGLLTGQLAVASLPGRHYKNADVIPLSAVLHEDEKAFVFQLDADRVFRKPVVLMDRHENLQIISGLERDSVIVSRGVGSLADGQPVRVDRAPR